MATQLGILSITLSDDNAASFSAVPKGTTQALLVCESNSIRWRADGTAPTRTGSDTGTLMAAGDTLSFMGSDYGDMLRRFQVINAGAGSNGTIRGAAFSGLDRA